jgi:hypothetical protein
MPAYTTHTRSDLTHVRHLDATHRQAEQSGHVVDDLPVFKAIAYLYACTAHPTCRRRAVQRLQGDTACRPPSAQT